MRDHRQSLCEYENETQFQTTGTHVFHAMYSTVEDYVVVYPGELKEQVVPIITKPANSNQEVIWRYPQTGGACAWHLYPGDYELYIQIEDGWPGPASSYIFNGNPPMNLESHFDTKVWQGVMMAPPVPFTITR